MRWMLASGYRTLLSDGIWYLDRLDQDWKSMYNNEPHEFAATEEQAKLVLGGQVS